MIIEEAIERYSHNAEYERANGNLQGCLEFNQLADWLKDYKRLLEQEPCEDCTSREETRNLMRSLTRWCVRSEDGKFNNVGLLYDDVMFGIDRLPSVQSKTGWIPVSEGLPEDIRPVMVTWKNIDPKSYYQYIVGKHFIGVAHYLNGKWYWYSSTTEDFLAEYGRYEGEEFDEAIEVVAWCKLPEPYKESEARG